MKKISLIASGILISGILFLNGCGSNESTNSNIQSTDTALNKGVFTDSPVKNLFYQTSSGIKGYTDQNGTFFYKTGDYVTFKLGNLTIGDAKASPVVTPSSFFESPNIFETLPFVLQSLDTDGNISNGIQLPSPEVLSKVSFSDINLSNLTDISNDITTIKSELKNIDKNYTFPNMNLEASDINYMFFTILNYYTFMKNTKKSFLVLSNGINSNILKLENNKIYSNNKLIGSYKFDINQSLLSKISNIFYTADNLPSNNLTINNSSISSNPISSANLLDLNITGNILKIVPSPVNFGNVWWLVKANDSNEDIIYQTNDIKSAILLNFSINNSFKTNTNAEFYITKITSNGEENGIIQFEKDGNVTITFGKETINAFVSDDGNIYSKNNNLLDLNASDNLYNYWTNSLMIGSENNESYIIGPEKEDINQTILFFNKLKNTKFQLNIDLQEQ